MIKNKNFSHQRIANFMPANGEVIEDCNFTQPTPWTPIAEGVSGLTFRNCNLVNCSPPSDSVVESCNRAQISRHTEACPVDCEHLISSENIIVDGVVVDTILVYEDKVVGVWQRTM
ncbi:MAG: hypothetical protein RBR82_17345 [Pseudomonas sp.]|nr:hypothetical protein [Pseudomonas sp.]